MGKLSNAFCGDSLEFLNQGPAVAAYFDPDQNFDYDKAKEQEKPPPSIFGDEVSRKFQAFKWSQKHLDELDEFGDGNLIITLIITYISCVTLKSCVIVF